MNNGLSERDLSTIKNILRKYSAIKKVFLFGSRAKGNFKLGSDVDLAIMDKGVKDRDLNKIKSELDESSLPYIVDIVHYPSLKSKELIEHIDRVGKIFYEQT